MSRSPVAVLALVGVFVLLAGDASARRGCCSWHGGIDYCDTSVGRYVCNDGSYSPTCGCRRKPPKKGSDFPRSSDPYWEELERVNEEYWRGVTGR